jgi:alpha-tubulin suppressor-like RCC1 family protein
MKTKKVMFMSFITTILFASTTNAASTIPSISAGAIVDNAGQVTTWLENGHDTRGTEFFSLNQQIYQADLSHAIQAQRCGTHSIALQNNGTVWSWGWNDFGSLGNGSDVERLSNGGLNTRKLPDIVENLSNVVAISCSNHNMALESDGTVWTWGLNGHGQSGVERPTKAVTVPTKIEGLENVVSINAGIDSSYAIKKDGTLWSWGTNTGSMSGNQSTKPVQVWDSSDKLMSQDQPVGIQGVYSISANWHKILLKEDGTVWGWGDNNYGQLGDLPNGESYYSDGIVNSSSGNTYTKPTQINGIEGAIAVMAADKYSAALLSDGTVYAWGKSFGKAPQKVDRLENIIAIAPGTPLISSHSIAVRNDGSVLVWGPEMATEVLIPNSSVPPIINTRFNGKLKHFIYSPSLVDNKTYFDLTYTFQLLGWEVRWDIENETIVCEKKGKEIRFELKQNSIYSNGTNSDFGDDVRSINNVMMISASFIAQSLDAQVQWNSSSNTIDINLK